MMVESGDIQQGGDGSVTAVGVSPLDADLLDASLRLVRLVAAPNEYRVVAPLVTREIVYRLLMALRAIDFAILQSSGARHTESHERFRPFGRVSTSHFELRTWRGCCI